MINIDRIQLRDKYKLETGNEPIDIDLDSELSSSRYIEWLEDKIERFEQRKEFPLADRIKHSRFGVPFKEVAKMLGLDYNDMVEQIKRGEE